MPLTREQICEIKAAIKVSIDELIQNDAFIQRVCEILTKTIGKKIDEALKTYSDSIEHLEEQNNALQGKIDNLEQYTRRNNLRISGLAEEHDENLERKVIAFCKDKLGVTIESKNIDGVHRLGKADKSKSSRPITIQFTNHGCKKNIIKSRSKLKHFKEIFFINEDLTKIRHELYKAAQKKWGNKNVWILDGIIKVKIADKVSSIKSSRDLQIYSLVKYSVL
ncbi:hypothetical protein QE152_g38176 [Popillia japonica]|uniref:Uncharacterized protein n=1 Tax=Popillia japonica TaxID=7064 RepID=A0AAW1I7G7_POPJA